MSAVKMVKKILYLGTDPSHYKTDHLLIHYPVIKIVPCPKEKVTPYLENWDAYTHVVFTSKNGVAVLASYGLDYSNKMVVAIGSVTAATLEKQKIAPDWIAEEETQEGIIALMQSKNLQGTHFLLPRSSRARPVLLHYFNQIGIRYTAFDLYDTHFQKIEPFPNLNEIEEIVFTSPSTVEAFHQICPVIPEHIKCTPIGSITESVLFKNV